MTDLYHYSSTLATILSSPTEITLPTSPGGSIASTFLSHATTAEDEDSDPSPPQPATLLEIELLNLLLSTLSSTAPIPSSLPRSTSTLSALPPLTITMRDAILVSSLISTSSSAASPPRIPLSTTKKQDPMVSMNALKIWLGTFSNERNWEDLGSGGLGSTPMGTNAIYALVGKAVLRIDRRGKEGPMLGFRN